MEWTQIRRPISVSDDDDDSSDQDQDHQHPPVPLYYQLSLTPTIDLEEGNDEEKSDQISHVTKSTQNMTISRLWSLVRQSSKRNATPSWSLQEVPEWDIERHVMVMDRRTKKGFRNENVIQQAKEGFLFDVIAKREVLLRKESALAEPWKGIFLPWEIILEISSFLSGEDVSRTLCQVCKEWRSAFEADEMWKLRYQNEYSWMENGDNDGDEDGPLALPSSFGWKQKYVARNAYTHNRCTFCLSYCFETLPEMLHSTPIANLRLYVCVSCQDTQLMSKTRLKKLHSCSDTELRQLTSYKRRGTSRAIYFLSEFFAVLDDRGQDVDDTLQSRRDKREKLAKRGIERLIKKEKDKRESMAETVAIGANVPIEVARDWAQRNNMHAKNMFARIDPIQTLKMQQYGAEYLTQLLGRDLTSEDEDELEIRLRANSSFHSEKHVRTVLNNYIRTKSIDKAFDDAIAKKFEGRYMRCDDLPRVCRDWIEVRKEVLECDRKVLISGDQSYVDDQDGINAHWKPRRKTVVQSALDSYVREKIAILEHYLEREEKVQNLIEQAGFNYGALDECFRNSQLKDYITGTVPDYSAAGVAKDLLCSYAKSSAGFTSVINGSTTYSALPFRDRRRFLRQLLKELLAADGENNAEESSKNTSELIALPVPEIDEDITSLFEDYKEHLYVWDEDRDRLSPETRNNVTRSILRGCTNLRHFSTFDAAYDRKKHMLGKLLVSIVKDVDESNNSNETEENSSVGKRKNENDGSVARKRQRKGN